MRDQLNAALKEAMRNKNDLAVSTLRLILAALKDRDIAARAKGEKVSDDDLMRMMQTMVKQRRESIAMYQNGGRDDLVAREQGEISVIEQFLPTQLSEEEMDAAVSTIIEEVGANCLKDMGSCMGALRDRYAGQMDFGKASAIVKKKLA